MLKTILFRIKTDTSSQTKNNSDLRLDKILQSVFLETEKNKYILSQ